MTESRTHTGRRTDGRPVHVRSARCRWSLRILFLGAVLLVAAAPARASGSKTLRFHNRLGTKVHLVLQYLRDASVVMAGDSSGVDHLHSMYWEGWQSIRHGQHVDIPRRVARRIEGKTVHGLWLHAVRVEIVFAGHRGLYVPGHHRVLDWQDAPNDHEHEKRGLVPKYTRGFSHGSIGAWQSGSPPAAYVKRWRAGRSDVVLGTYFDLRAYRQRGPNGDWHGVGAVEKSAPSRAAAARWLQGLVAKKPDTPIAKTENGKLAESVIRAIDRIRKKQGLSASKPLAGGSSFLRDYEAATRGRQDYMAADGAGPYLQKAIGPSVTAWRWTRTFLPQRNRQNPAQIVEQAVARLAQDPSICFLDANLPHVASFVTHSESDGPFFEVFIGAFAVGSPSAAGPPPEAGPQSAPPAPEAIVAATRPTWNARRRGMGLDAARATPGLTSVLERMLDAMLGGGGRPAAHVANAWLVRSSEVAPSAWWVHFHSMPVAGRTAGALAEQAVEAALSQGYRFPLMPLYTYFGAAAAIDGTGTAHVLVGSMAPRSQGVLGPLLEKLPLPTLLKKRLPYLVLGPYMGFGNAHGASTEGDLHGGLPGVPRPPGVAGPSGTGGATTGPAAPPGFGLFGGLPVPKVPGSEALPWAVPLALPLFEGGGNGAPQPTAARPPSAPPPSPPNTATIGPLDEAAQDLLEDLTPAFAEEILFLGSHVAGWIEQLHALKLSLGTQESKGNTPIGGVGPNQAFVDSALALAERLDRLSPGLRDLLGIDGVHAREVEVLEQRIARFPFNPETWGGESEREYRAHLRRIGRAHLALHIEKRLHEDVRERIANLLPAARYLQAFVQGELVAWARKGRDIDGVRVRVTPGQRLTTPLFSKRSRLKASILWHEDAMHEDTGLYFRYRGVDKPPEPMFDNLSRLPTTALPRNGLLWEEVLVLENASRAALTVHLHARTSSRDRIRPPKPAGRLLSPALGKLLRRRWHRFPPSDGEPVRYDLAPGEVRLLHDDEGLVLTSDRIRIWCTDGRGHEVDGDAQKDRMLVPRGGPVVERQRAYRARIARACVLTFGRVDSDEVREDILTRLNRHRRDHGLKAMDRHVPAWGMSQDFVLEVVGTRVSAQVRQGKSVEMLRGLRRKDPALEDASWVWFHVPHASEDGISDPAERAARFVTLDASLNRLVLEERLNAAAVGYRSMEGGAVVGLMLISHETGHGGAK